MDVLCLRLELSMQKKYMERDRLSIGVFENNLPAIRCYKSAGFKGNRNF